MSGKGPRLPSREAAKERSPRRKPWVDEAIIDGPRMAKETKRRKQGHRRKLTDRKLIHLQDSSRVLIGELARSLIGESRKKDDRLLVEGHCAHSR